LLVHPPQGPDTKREAVTSSDNDVNDDSESVQDVIAIVSYACSCMVFTVTKSILEDLFMVNSSDHAGTRHEVDSATDYDDDEDDFDTDDDSSDSEARALLAAASKTNFFIFP